MKKIVIVILTVIACSKTEENKKIIVSQKRLPQELADKEIVAPIKESSFDTISAIPIVNHLIESSLWFNSERDWWYANRHDKGDTIKSIVLSNVLKSGNFSAKMYKAICANAEKGENVEFGFLPFGCYYYSDKILGKVLDPFCTKDTNEIIKNLEIKGDSAKYSTEFFKVGSEIPYNDDRYEWLSKLGENNEKWLYTVYLVKEDGEWKIDKVDKYFGLYKE